MSPTALLALSQEASGGLPLAPLDLVGLGLVATFLVLGLVRGLWWQVIRLAGVVAAVVLARSLSPRISPWIQDQWPDVSARLAHGAAWFGIFVVALIAATLLGLLGRKLLEAMQLGIVDRVGGGLVGAVTGLVLHLALLVAICLLGPEAFVGKAVADTWSEEVLRAVSDRWSTVYASEAGDEVRDILDRARERLDGEEPGGGGSVR